MPVQKLTEIDAFVVSDIPDVPAVGIVRTAPKILIGGATDMARSASYTFALYGHKVSGASAGLNYSGDDLAAEVGRFAAELAPLHAAGKLSIFAGKGIDADLIGDLSGSSQLDFDRATSTTVLAAATSVMGGSLAGKRIAIEGDPHESLVEMLGAAGAEIVTVDGIDKKPWLIWGADVDLLLAGSKVGALTHEGVPHIKASAIVCWGPAAVTTKAFAMLLARDVIVVPGFLAAAGGLLLAYEDNDAIAARVDAVLEAASQADESVLLGACKVAEQYLASWTDAKLFGRPLA